MLLVIIAVVIVGLVSLGIFGCKKQTKKYDDPWEALTVVCWILAIIILVVSSIIITCMSVDNLNNATNLQTFYESNADNHEAIIEITEDLLTIDGSNENALIDIYGSVERGDVGSTVGEQLQKYRDDVNDYNSRLNRMRMWDRNIIFGIMVPTIPKEITPIKIK